MTTPAGSPPSRSCTMLYKVLTLAEYSSISLSEPYHGTAFDLSVGFHHLAVSLHIPYVLAAHFTQEKEIWLLAIAREAVEERVMWTREVVDGVRENEESVGVRGAIDPLREVALRRRCEKVDGVWDLGELLW